MPQLIRVAISLAALAAFTPAMAQDGIAFPVEVEIGVALLDIESIDSVSQSFVANLYFELKWHDPGQIHDGPGEISRPLYQVWNPRVQIINQQRLVKTFPEVVEIAPDGLVTYRQRVWGAFSQPLQLTDFPFDAQTLNIEWTAAGFSPDEVALNAAGHSEVSEHVSLPDWSITNWSVHHANLSLGAGPDSVIHTVTLSLDVKRDTGYFIFKVIFPLVLIVMMSWLVYWIDPRDFGPQISVAITTMLTLIAYRFAIGGMVPKLSFLTSLDYFIIGATVLVFLGLVEVIVTARLVAAGKVDLAAKVDRVGRWLAPVLLFLVIMEALYYRHLI